MAEEPQTNTEENIENTENQQPEETVDSKQERSNEDEDQKEGNDVCIESLSCICH